MSNQEIENQLAQCRIILDDLDVIMEEVLEGEPTKDQIANVLIGMKQLHEMRLDKLERLVRAEYATIQ